MIYSGLLLQWQISKPGGGPDFSDEVHTSYKKSNIFCGSQVPSTFSHPCSVISKKNGHWKSRAEPLAGLCQVRLQTQLRGELCWSRTAPRYFCLVWCFLPVPQSGSCKRCFCCFPLAAPGNIPKYNRTNGKVVTRMQGCVSLEESLLPCPSLQTCILKTKAIAFNPLQNGFH